MERQREIHQGNNKAPAQVASLAWKTLCCEVNSEKQDTPPLLDVPPALPAS